MILFSIMIYAAVAVLVLAGGVALYFKAMANWDVWGVEEITEPVLKWWWLWPVGAVLVGREAWKKFRHIQETWGDLK